MVNNQLNFVAEKIGFLGRDSMRQIEHQTSFDTVVGLGIIDE